MSPNTVPTEITQPLTATEGAADPKSAGPRIRFYAAYQSITERERFKCIRAFSFETRIDRLFEIVSNGQAAFCPRWKRSLIDQLIAVIAENLPSGSGPEIAGPFDLACSSL